jgi:serine/threonine protein kinase
MSGGLVSRLRGVLEEPDLEGTKYELVRELDRGGMGVVWLVRDRELDREVAMKVVSVDSASLLAPRMRQEARILARLEHPGIVPVHDVGLLPDGRLFYVMKYVRGERLDRFAAGTARGELLRIFMRICEAVSFAHAHGIVHRDLKPQNVMIGPFGEVLVLDWGVAKQSGGDDLSRAETPGTGHGVVIGTPGFMSPEQESGAEVDPRSDVFALGALLRFLIEGNSSAPLRSVVSRATAAEPAHRYASAAELSADVGRFLDHEPVVAHREGFGERLLRWGARYRVPLTLILAYLLMRVAIFFWVRR